MASPETARDPGLRLPVRHPDVALGPVCVSGWRRQHLVGLPGGDRVLLLGDLEYGVLRRLDGTSTVEQICTDAGGPVGPMPPARLGRLLAVFARRGLLSIPDQPGGAGHPAGPDGTTDADRPVPSPSSPSRPSPARPSPSRLHRRWETTRVDRWLRPLVPGARRLASGAGAAICGLMVVLALIQFVHQAPIVLPQARAAMSSWVSAPVVVAALLASLAIHEMGHALGCLAFGGRVRAIGVLWRFPLVTAYADVPGYQLLPHRRQRIAVCFAGVWTSLLLLVPVAVAWWLVPGPAVAIEVLAAVQVGLIGSSAFNLVPLFGSDGYRMLAQWLSIRNLGLTSTEVLVKALRPNGRAELRAAGSPRLLAIYLGYAVFCALSVLATAALVTGLVTWAAARWAGPLAGAGAAMVTILVMIGGALLAARRGGRSVAAG